MMKKFKFWFHYILLVAVLFLAHWLSGFVGLEALTQTNFWLGWILIFIWYYVFFIIGDQLIHYILGEKR